MNQFLGTGVALIIVLSIWGLGKRPKKVFNTRVSENPFFNHATLVDFSVGFEESSSSEESSPISFRAPSNSKERYLLRKMLRSLISSEPEQRLLAIKTAQQWGDSSVLPILKLGLRDSDSRVVINAAQAISKFKGTYKQNQQKKKSVSHPLNVSLMR